jgi:hypothetical protein
MIAGFVCNMFEAEAWHVSYDLPQQALSRAILSFRQPAKKEGINK